MKFWKRFGGYMPILATIVVVGCVGTALKGYAAPVYEVEQPENIQSTEADAKEKMQETEETEQAKKGNFDLADGFYKGSGTRVLLQSIFSAPRMMRFSLTEPRVSLTKLLSDRHWMWTWCPGQPTAPTVSSVL